MKSFGFTCKCSQSDVLRETDAINHFVQCNISRLYITSNSCIRYFKSRLNPARDFPFRSWAIARNHTLGNRSAFLGVRREISRDERDQWLQSSTKLL